MDKSKRRVLLAAVLAVVAVPALAQFSEGFNFLKAVRDRDGAKVTQIVSNPSSTAIHARDRETGEGALHILARGRDAGWMNFLLARGARVDAQDGQGNSALMIASQIGWTEGVDLLLSRRANVNLPNVRGETALIVAVQRRDIALVRMLVSRGADPDRTDSVAGYSALDYARRDSRAAPILRILQERRPAQPSVGPPAR